MTTFGTLFQKWCALSAGARIVIVTDDVQYALAGQIGRESDFETEIICFSDFSGNMEYLKSLEPKDLLVALFSLDTFVRDGANRFFSPFGKPAWLKAKYAFVRLSISAESLRQGLSTEKKQVYDKIDEMSRYPAGEVLRVTNRAGTDISFQITPFATCAHEIREDGGFAFLPPSETSSDVVTETANGKIVVDMTIGQLYYFADLLGYFGIVDAPVTILVENGIITDIFGSGMAAELKSRLFALPEVCRMIVELGQGLSDMTPTGLIGVDECIIDSCHFGFGDGGHCGVHLDVVISEPTIEVLAD